MSNKMGTPRQSANHYGHSRTSAHVRSARKAKSSRDALVFTIVAIVALVAVVGGGALLWLNRTVSVKVDGSLVSVSASSTLASIAEAEGVSVTPGNLVSVGGNVLTEGGGAAFSATVNGKELDAEGLDSFRAAGNEEIVFGDGADVTEPFHEEERTIEPKMEPYEKIGAVTFVAQWPKPGKGVYRVGETSGEEVLVEEEEPAQNLVIQSVNPQPDDGSKVIALTFDDGPSDYTQRYLDILSEYDAKATFFCLGNSIKGNEDLVKAIEAQGSQVASHTQAHKQLTTLGSEDLQSEVSKTFSAISDAGASATTVLRPPYGDFNNDSWLASGGKLSASIIWNLDSEDWRLPGADAIVSNCTNGAYSGAIILMHDGGGNRDQDLKALPKILETLKKKGYSFVTIDELMAMDSRIPAEVASGNASMPEGGVWPTEMVQ